MKLTGLSRQIAFSMMMIASGAALLVFLGSFLFYYLWDKYWPGHVPDDVNLAPSGPEWIWIIGTLLLAVLLAVVVAIHLSRRILEPLNSVSEGIRKLAKGDLEARAVAEDPSLGEAALLADDFNVLAEKLQRMTQEQSFWNAAIAHELRTPVTILRGRLQGLAEGVFPADEAQFRRLLIQVEGLSRLIEDLRVVSLMESGNLTINLQLTRLATHIQWVADAAEHMLQAASQHLIVDVEDHAVPCDPDRIRQALLALLENASKYAVPGAITITFRVRNGLCQLSVEDEGPGISPDCLPHIFTAFRRANGTVRGGSGLGLAVVAAIAQAHGGSAACHARAARGSLFELSWPCTPP